MIDIELNGENVRLEKVDKDIIFRYGANFEANIILEELENQKLISAGVSGNTLYVHTPDCMAEITGNSPVWSCHVKERS